MTCPCLLLAFIFSKVTYQHLNKAIHTHSFSMENVISLFCQGFFPRPFSTVFFLNSFTLIPYHSNISPPFQLTFLFTDLWVPPVYSGVRSAHVEWCPHFPPIIPVSFIPHTPVRLTHSLCSLSPFPIFPT